MTEILKDFVGAYFLSMRDDLCNNNIDAIEALIIISKPYNKNTNYTNDYSIY